MAAPGWMEKLSELIGCQPPDVPDLLASFPALAPSDARHYLVLQLRFVDGHSSAEVAAMLGVTRQRIPPIVREAISKLSEVHRGRGEFTARLRNGISDLLGTTSWAVEEAAPKLNCRELLRRKNIGRTSVRQLHAIFRARGLSMACGCPSIPCEMAINRLAARVVLGPDELESQCS